MRGGAYCNLICYFLNTHWEACLFLSEGKTEEKWIGGGEQRGCGGREWEEKRERKLWSDYNPGMIQAPNNRAWSLVQENCKLKARLPA